ncbi:uncharacterized protein LOC110036701 [Phalaenopsis equestris]|uniref:uncharacterized protein LOC110036701 n=1 Tax=Phalaenopsis equestris TaxID=78828 RepID=UPI0009E1C534|nr:uncharacterized protein LOC110036701 [Phalaenopsis equestris]
MELVRNYFESLNIADWKLGFLDSRHLIIQLTKKEDYARIFAKQSIIIAGAEMKNLKWTPEYDPSQKPPIVPIWFKLLKLPLHLFKLNALFNIGCTLETPLKVDAITYNKARPVIARILVERDVTLPDVKRIWIENSLKGFWQEVVMEQRPHYYPHCKMFGHTKEKCYRLHPPNSRRTTYAQPEPNTEHTHLLRDNNKEDNLQNSMVVRTANTNIPTINQSTPHAQPVVTSLDKKGETVGEIVETGNTENETTSVKAILRDSTKAAKTTREQEAREEVASPTEHRVTELNKELESKWKIQKTRKKRSSKKEELKKGKEKELVLMEDHSTQRRGSKLRGRTRSRSQPSIYPPSP